MEEEIEYPVGGSCQCGKITYQVTSPPLFVAVCHCTECQKLSASAFGITMVLTEDSFKVDGELKIWERNSDSGDINRAHFCPTCGNRIYHIDPEKPELIRLKAGTLSSTDIIQPNAHFWVSEKQDWVTIPEGIDQHETQPEF
jgi:hypothetical protein